MHDEMFETDSFETDFELIDQEDEGSDYETADQELELAAELLSVSDDRELDQFLGKLFKKVGGAARGILATPAGQQLKGLLRDTAKKALPLGGQAIGSFFGGDRGGNIGQQAGQLAGTIFGLELEGMSGEDQELEVARQYVRLATDAAKQVAAAPRITNPRQAAQAALQVAAQRHAPGLVRGGTVPAVTRPRATAGRWVRRGRTVVLIGV